MRWWKRPSPAPPAPQRVLEFGRPGPCPRCDAHGRLDHIDPARWESRHSCPVCGHRWRLRRDEPGVVFADPDPLPSPVRRRPGGAGSGR